VATVNARHIPFVRFHNLSFSSIPPCALPGGNTITICELFSLVEDPLFFECCICHNNGRHPLGGASYLDLDTVLSEQGSGHRILSDALHRRPGVVKNEQESSHLTRRMRRVRKLAEPNRVRVGTWNVGSLTGKL
jgi:hypothetical protein